LGSDIAVGVADNDMFSAPWVAPGPAVDGVSPPPPHAASVIAAATTRELRKALANLAGIPVVTSIFIIFLPEPHC
jgi:hypothetical protein